MNPILKYDLHIHTNFSKDCRLKPSTITKICLNKGIGGIGATDHNTIDGTLEIKRLASFPVIIGKEIKTTCGEIIGYFLNEEIPPGLSPEDTVSRIKKQDRLVCIPHPFDLLRKSGLNSNVLDLIIGTVHIIEAYNSRNLFVHSNSLAIEYGQKYGKLPLLEATHILEQKSATP